MFYSRFAAHLQPCVGFGVAKLKRLTKVTAYVEHFERGSSLTAIISLARPCLEQLCTPYLHVNVKMPWHRRV
eukprot:6214749-Pleurochrysis_carterae.AAC.8